VSAHHLALGLRDLGMRVGLLDADIYGPSMPRLLAIKGKPETIGGRMLRPSLIHWPPKDGFEGDPFSYLRFAREMVGFYDAHVREPLFVWTTRLFLGLTGVAAAITLVALLLPSGERAHAARIQGRLAPLLDAAEGEQGLAARGGRLGAGPGPGGGLLVEMEPDLVVQVALPAALEQQCAEPLEEVGDHRSASRTRRIPSTAAAVRRHAAVSASSWRCPLAVSS
jgi:hypothetical protein